MYTNILEAALRDRSQPDAGMTTEEALAVFLECRLHLESAASSERIAGLGFCGTGQPGGLRSRSHRSRPICRHRL